MPKKKRRVLERVRPEKEKKNRALTTEKKGKIETVRLGFFFFFFFYSSCWQPVKVEQWWRSNGGGDREREM